MKLIKYTFYVLLISVIFGTFSTFAYQNYNAPSSGIIPIYFELSGTGTKKTDYYYRNGSDYMQSYKFEQNITNVHPDGCTGCTIRATLYKKNETTGEYYSLHEIIGQTGDNYYFDGSVIINSYDAGRYQLAIRRHTFVVVTTYTFGDWYINQNNPDAVFHVL